MNPSTARGEFLIELKLSSLHSSASTKCPCDSSQPDTESWIQGCADEFGEMPLNSCRLVTKVLPLRMEYVFKRSPADLTDLTTSGNYSLANRDLRGHGVDLVVSNGKTIDPLEQLATCEKDQRLKMGCVVAHRRAVFLEKFAIDPIALGVPRAPLQMLPGMIPLEALTHEPDASIVRRPTKARSQPGRRSGIPPGETDTRRRPEACASRAPMRQY